VIEEYLYSAMEDYKIDIMIESGPNARSVQINLSPFTLIGATTRSGLLTAPLRSRFGINSRLSYYNSETIEKIIKRSAKILDVEIENMATREISRRSRGTPRIANMLLRRVRDFAQVKGDGTIDLEIAKYALVISMIMGQGGVVLSFIPVNQSIFALVLTSIFYSATGLFHIHIQEALFKERIREYIFVLGFALVVLILTLQF